MDLLGHPTNFSGIAWCWLCPVSWPRIAAPSTLCHTCLIVLQVNLEQQGPPHSVSLWTNLDPSSWQPTILLLDTFCRQIPRSGLFLLIFSLSWSVSTSQYLTFFSNNYCHTHHLQRAICSWFSTGCSTSLHWSQCPSPLRDSFCRILFSPSDLAVVCISKTKVQEDFSFLGLCLKIVS